MSEVILIVPSRPERRERLVTAANRLGELIGGGRVVELAPAPAEAGFAAPRDSQLGVPTGRQDAAAVVEERGRRADFLVAAQPEAGDDKATWLEFRTALFRTERPVLMVPGGGDAAAFGRRVAIAWRDDARTVKALMPALKLLSGADEVHLLAGVRAGKPTPGVPPVLLEHGIPAQLHVLAIGAGPFGELLLERARELAADMLIVGAHAHTRLHDVLLGGVTSYLVAHADLPVLLRN
jgi:nucleotide-binding universal stress UspA family protein